MIHILLKYKHNFRHCIYNLLKNFVKFQSACIISLKLMLKTYTIKNMGGSNWIKKLSKNWISQRAKQWHNQCSHKFANDFFRYFNKYIVTFSSFKSFNKSWNPILKPWCVRCTLTESINYGY